MQYYYSLSPSPLSRSLFFFSPPCFVFVVVAGGGGLESPKPPLSSGSADSGLYAGSNID